MNALNLKKASFGEWLDKAKKTLNSIKTDAVSDNQDQMDSELRKIQEERQNFLKWAKT